MIKKFIRIKYIMVTFKVKINIKNWLNKFHKLRKWTDWIITVWNFNWFFLVVHLKVEFFSYVENASCSQEMATYWSKPECWISPHVLDTLGPREQCCERMPASWRFARDVSQMATYQQSGDGNHYKVLNIKIPISLAFNDLNTT